jgi:hypothetical protein
MIVMKIAHTTYCAIIRYTDCTVTKPIKRSKMRLESLCMIGREELFVHHKALCSLYTMSRRGKYLNDIVKIFPALAISANDTKM